MFNKTLKYKADYFFYTLCNLWFNCDTLLFLVKAFCSISREFEAVTVKNVARLCARGASGQTVSQTDRKGERTIQEMRCGP